MRNFLSISTSSHGDTIKELNKLKRKKASPKLDVPIKNVKENVDVIPFLVL